MPKTRAGTIYTSVSTKRSAMPYSRKMIGVSALILLGMSAWVHVHLAIMGDKGWLLFAAREWLGGKKLYVDIFEVNPPLILWIYAVPIWVSMHVPFLTDYAALGIMGLIASVMTLLLCLPLMARHPAFAGDRAKQGVFALLLAGIFIFITSPMFFFDRDHILLVLTFPYMLRFAPSLARIAFPVWLRAAIGLLAATGFCIKPYGLIVFAGIQLLCLLHGYFLRMMQSMETVIILLLGAGYCAVIAAFMPEYFYDVLPIAFATYADYNIVGNTRYFMIMAFFGAIIPFCKFQPRFETPYRPEVYYFAGVTFLYLVYARLGNGWGYTYHPLFCMLFFLTAWLLWEYSWLARDHQERGLPYRHLGLGRMFCAVSILFNLAAASIVMIAALVAPVSDGAVENDSNKQFVEYLHKNALPSFGVMSAEFTRWPQISRQSGARWDTRFNHLWMVPALMRSEKESAASPRWIVDYVGQAYAQDMDSRKPAAMFVDNSEEFFTYSHHVELLAIFSRVPQFATAWSHYRFDSSIDFCKPGKSSDLAAKVGCRYDIYRRTDSP